MENQLPSPKGFKLWWMSFRPYAFPASIMPVLYGSLIAVLFNPGLKFNFYLFALTLFGSVFVHIVANLVNDIYDYKKGVDKEDSITGIPHGGSFVLSKGFMSVRQMQLETVIFLFLSVFVAVVLYFYVGIWIVYLSLFGLFTSVFYTAAPLSLKYKALGDIMVFLSFGIGMTLGAYIVQTKQFSWSPVFLAIPFGLLIVAILHSNNIRDLIFDRTFGIKTIPILIGEKFSKYFYYFLIFGAYGSIIIFIAVKLLPWFAILNFISFPSAYKLAKMLNNIPEEAMAKFEFGTKHNIMTAQLNTQFGVTLMLGIIISFFV
jgi:1,4-dihydroxy-2-naphthoate octaprenyltransferase